MELRNEVSASNEELGKDTTLNTEPASEVVAEAEQEINATEAEASEPTSEYSSMSKAELVAALEALVERPVEEIKREENAIKMAFYQIRKEELDKEKEAFLAKGNEEAAFAPREDEDEAKLKDLLNQIKEKRAAHNAAIEEARAKNLEAKQAIIDEIMPGIPAPKQHRITDREQAIRAALELAVPGDVVLIAGKGHENYQIFKDETINFSDAAVVRKYYAERNPEGRSVPSRKPDNRA